MGCKRFGMLCMACLHRKHAFEQAYRVAHGTTVETLKSAHPAPLYMHCLSVCLTAHYPPSIPQEIWTQETMIPMTVRVMVHDALPAACA